MDNRRDAMVADELGDERAVAGVSDDERRVRRYRPFKSGRKVVEDNHALAHVEERVDHMAADVTGAPRHENRHGPALVTGPVDEILMRKGFAGNLLKRLNNANICRMTTAGAP